MVDKLEPYMLQTLAGFVRAESPSGAEEPAAAFFEDALRDLGMEPERILLDSSRIEGLPYYACPCSPDNGRYNLLACHHPSGRGHGRSVLFNGHLDIVPTGPHDMWSRSPYEPAIVDGWLHGRGSGDMKAGLICALTAYKALRELGLQPAGTVGFNAVLDEENTGNGTLASVHALQNALARAKLSDFDAVVIPEPFGETLLSAQVGVCWLSVRITGKPAHVAYMNSGINPIEAGIAIMADLKQLEAEWNAPGFRHPAFADQAHPINFNLGHIEGGEWHSSVPCVCTLDIRVSFYPGMEPGQVRAALSERIKAAAVRANPSLRVDIEHHGQYAPACLFDLDAPAMRVLAQAHEKVVGAPPRTLACTATTDAKHFHTADVPVTCYGPEARNIHGIDEAVSIASMKRVAAAMAQYMADWCGLEPSEI